MAYIGKTPVIGNFQKCDSISVVNGQAAYTLQVGGVNVSPQSENHMLVSLNGILQSPVDSFTVSGSTLTFASNLVTGDVIDFVMILGNVLDLGVPSDNTVTTAKLADSSVTAAKLASGVGGVAGITSSADATAITIDSSENVGIGTSSPGTKLDIVSDSSARGIYLRGRSADNIGLIDFRSNDGSTRYASIGSQSANTFSIETNSVERMRIQNSMRLDLFSKGYIGGTSNFFISDDTGYGFSFDQGSGIIYPGDNAGNAVDNLVDLGHVTFGRFDDICATNGTIQTSDQNEKQSIQSLTTAEMNVGKRLSSLIKTFKWNSAVEEKGDSARTHTGIIAQDVQQAFSDEGLDASNYALFISGSHWEKEIFVEATEEKEAYTYIDKQKEEVEGYTKVTKLGIRYPELLSFIQAYNDQRFTDLEARITALENA